MKTLDLGGKIVGQIGFGAMQLAGPKLLAADPAIAEVAAARGATPAQIALAWLQARYPGNLLIPGTSSVAHLEENLAAADIDLTDDEMARLEDVRQTPMSR
jgi:aryl-alcohol dehydrogenase-like predicted oxidoreductase